MGFRKRKRVGKRERERKRDKFGKRERAVGLPELLPEMCKERVRLGKNKKNKMVGVVNPHHVANPNSGLLSFNLYFYFQSR